MGKGEWLGRALEFECDLATTLEDQRLMLVVIHHIHNTSKCLQGEGEGGGVTRISLIWFHANRNRLIWFLTGSHHFVWLLLSQDELSVCPQSYPRQQLCNST